jgi:hypothetical protein
MDACRDETQGRSFNFSHNRARVFIGNLCGGQVPEGIIPENAKKVT